MFSEIILFWRCKDAVLPFSFLPVSSPNPVLVFVLVPALVWIMFLNDADGRASTVAAGSPASWVVHGLTAFAACSLRRGVDLSLIGREGQDNKKGFASSSEVSDQNNVAALRTTSKHKIESICGKSKSKDEIRFEVG